jgi:hypothetical protein
MLDKLNPGAGICTKPAATSTSSASAPFKLTITGQNLAKGRRTKRQRIALAESFIAGTTVLVRPTVKQSAALARIPVAEVYRSRQARKPKPTPPAPPSLAEHFAKSSPAERAEAARAIGVDRVWDEMVLPLVSSAAGGA